LRNYSDAELIEMYDKLKTARIYSHMMEKAVYGGLIRSSFHTPLGQEATGVGIVTAAKKSDWLGYTHRGQIILYERFGLQPLITELFGFRGGIHKGTTFDFHCNDFSEDGVRILGMPGTLGSAIPQHVGFAWAQKYRGKNDVVIAPHGEGGCSEGAVYEAWNLAALYKAPIVFVIENNGWGLSVPLERQSANPNIAEKAGACGLPYQIVQDGTDILAVREALDIAIEKARNYEPNVVEIKNLRWGPHFIGQPNDYRNDLDRLSEAQEGKGDCVKRFETYLKEKGLIDQAYIERKEQEIKAMLEKCYEVAAKSEKPTFEEIYNMDNIYATPETGGDL